MAEYRVCVIGGWCGNRMVMVAQHLEGVLLHAGLPSRVTAHSVWDNYTRPPAADLILQLLPAFTQAETGCPVLTIKPMIVDLDHQETLEKILKQVRASYPV